MSAYVWSKYSAVDFLNPSKMQASEVWPASDKWNNEQYQKGLELAKEWDIHISANDVWGGSLISDKGRSDLSSYEKIGYHSGTGALLKGFLDSGKPIIVCRVIEDKIRKFRLLDGEVAEIQA